MNYIKKILLLYFTLLGLISNGQIIRSNLVQNSSFEEYYQCPYSSGQLPFSKFWWGRSTEYYNGCGINNNSVPSNWSGFQFAKTGNAYAGFLLYSHIFANPSNNTYIESIKNILKDSLIKNKRYCIDYYVSLSEYTFNPLATIIYDSIGAMFSINQVMDSITPVICDTCAKFTKSVIALDTLNWLRISGSVLAKGGEKYLTIGKFNTMNWLPNISCEFYVYIDEVSVCECAYNVNLGMDTRLCEGESLLLNATLAKATYLWQDGSTSATYKAKQPGTYWVKAYVEDYDITTTDTIVITAEDENVCNTPALRIPNSFTPNGDGLNDRFAYFYTEYYDIRTFIYNRWGQLIFEGENTDFWDGTFKGKIVPLGVYAYKIETMDKRSQEKKVHSGRVTVVK